MNREYASWGMQPPPSNQSVQIFEGEIPHATQNGVLPHGLGRSYGDSCLNNDGVLLLTSKLNRFLEFNADTGVLKAQSGVSLDELLRVFVPKGWFVPVTPGTKYVTLGGAVANDVHGKNHHLRGSFGHHVLSLGLQRGNGEVLSCSSFHHPDLFAATIGGLGLTGLILWVEIQLVRIQSAWIDSEEIKFHSLQEFLHLSNESEKEFEYSVAWVDCIAGKNLRGIFFRGNHSKQGDLRTHKSPFLHVPFFLPPWLLNSWTMSLFNRLYFFKSFQVKKKTHVHYNGFFFPLDSINHWNRIYGRRGFYQYQFVIPTTAEGMQAFQKIFQILKQSQMGSFLAVLKIFGDHPAKGLLSFPRPGITLALDFQNTGENLQRMLKACDEVIQSVNGRVYPAKDARMSSGDFARSYDLQAFLKFRDPKFSSSFARRMNL